MKKSKLLALILGSVPQLFLAGSAIVTCTGGVWSSCLTDNPLPAPQAVDIQPPIQCSGFNCQTVVNGGCDGKYTVQFNDCLVRNVTVPYNYCAAYNSQGCPISLGAQFNGREGYRNHTQCF